MTPNPGSNAAIEQGCTCPVLDNGHGVGAWGGVRNLNGSVTFWTSLDCPLHKAWGKSKEVESDRP